MLYENDKQFEGAMPVVAAKGGLAARTASCGLARSQMNEASNCLGGSTAARLKHPRTCSQLSLASFTGGILATHPWSLSALVGTRRRAGTRGPSGLLIESCLSRLAVLLAPGTCSQTCCCLDTVGQPPG